MPILIYNKVTLYYTFFFMFYGNQNQPLAFLACIASAMIIMTNEPNQITKPKMIGSQKKWMFIV